MKGSPALLLAFLDVTHTSRAVSSEKPFAVSPVTSVLSLDQHCLSRTTNKPTNKQTNIPATIRHKFLFVIHFLPVRLDPHQVHLAPLLLTVRHRIRRPHLEALQRKHRIRARVRRRTNPRPPRLRPAGIVQRLCRVPALSLAVSLHCHLLSHSFIQKVGRLTAPFAASSGASPVSQLAIFQADRFSKRIGFVSGSAAVVSP